VPADIAEDLWTAIAGVGVVPAGLGARDTLRLEAALPLHGHELGPGITPLQAGLGWVVSWTKPEGFRGRDALEKERASGVPRHLIGLATEDRRPPRAGADLFIGDTVVAQLTSGNFSPVLGHGIGLALLPTDVGADAHRFEIDARGRRMPAVRAPLPFVAKKKG
jgi:aminomethyltransferase